jgi:transposase
MDAIKQSIGIDISKDTFTACRCQQTFSGDVSYTSVHSFTNDKKGFNQLIRWSRSQTEKGTEVVFLMEATGVYYESLAYHLHKLNKKVVVVLPNMSKHYFSSLNIKSKTDKIDAKILSRFGVERNHRLWEPAKPIYIELRNLTRYLVQLTEQRTALSNIKHSKEAANQVQRFILQSNQELIKQIEKQVHKCKLEIEALVRSDEALSQRVDQLLTIKGVGLTTVAAIIAETLGFEGFNSAKQLVSYAGYDVVQRESGTSIKGKTKISKKGNRYIRNALYFPAMVATRYNPIMKESYIRIIKTKPSKMIGQVAIQRKLLTLLYTLWKNNTAFDPNYNKVASPELEEATLDAQ